MFLQEKWIESVYSDANQVIFTQAFEHDATFNVYTIYAWFTGHMNGNRRELNVLWELVSKIISIFTEWLVNFMEDIYSYEEGKNVQFFSL